MPSNQDIRHQLARLATKLMSQVPRQERPETIRLVDRMMYWSGILDIGLDPKASPEQFGEQAFLLNGYLENHLQDMNLPNLMGAQDPQDLAGRLPSLTNHLE